MARLFLAVFGGPLLILAAIGAVTLLREPPRAVECSPPLPVIREQRT